MVNHFHRYLLSIFASALGAFLFANSVFSQDAPNGPPDPQVQQQTQTQDSQDQPDQLVAVPNRPTFASTAEAIRPGVFEIEYGMEAASKHQNINGVLKFGIFKNMELWLTNDHFVRDSGVAGVGDSQVGFKYKLYNQTKPLPTISIFYLAEIPTATAHLGYGAMGHSLQLLLSKDFGKHHFDYNFGPNFVGRPDGSGGFDRQYFNALSYSHPIRGKWAWTGEVAGYSRANTQNPASMLLLGALLYSPSPRLVIDCGGYFGVYGNLPTFTFAAGLTYSVGDAYHHRPHKAVGVPRKNF